MTRLLLLCVLVLALGSGCGGPKPAPEADIAMADAEEGRMEEGPLLPEPGPYRITVGDVLSVKFFYYSPYDFTALVRPDGIITVPLMGEVEAAGMRPTELEELIRNHYSEVLTQPEVSVMFIELANQRFFVFGEVVSPGAFPLLGRMTVMDAIAQAGDVTPSGRMDSVILMRKSPDGRYVARLIDVEAKIKRRDTEVIYLAPTDIVYVPISAIGKVDRFVDQFFAKLTPVWRSYILGRQVFNPDGQTIISD